MVNMQKPIAFLHISNKQGYFEIKKHNITDISNPKYGILEYKSKKHMSQVYMRNTSKLRWKKSRRTKEMNRYSMFIDSKTQYGKVVSYFQPDL